MSAWAAFATLGMYPLAGTDTFILSSPSLGAGLDISVPAPSGSGANTLSLSIRVHNASANRYIILPDCFSFKIPVLIIVQVTWCALQPLRQQVPSQWRSGGLPHGALV
jgi:hypothetical protein